MTREEMYFNALVRGMVAGAQVVRQSQFDGWKRGTIGGVEEKAIDGTFVTDTDRASESAVMRAIGTPEGLQIKGEEGSEAGEGNHRCIFDPLDGTHRMLIGGITSTVGGGLINEHGNLYAAATVVPATGHIMLTRPGGSTVLHTVAFDRDAEAWVGTNKIRQTRVWSGPLTKKATVFVDHTHGFVSQETPVLDDLETALFGFGMARHFTLARDGSNLWHQFMVAGGRPHVAASVTLAKGGVQDLVGVIHVLGAGGVARGYNVVRHDGLQTTLAQAEDVLKIEGYKILVCAANEDILDKIERILLASLSMAVGPNARENWATFSAL